MVRCTKDVKYPCRSCKYFSACGNSNRSYPCQGRELNSSKSHHTKS